MSASVPIGAIVAYAAPDATQLPWNWLVCDGSQLSVTSWPDLYAVVGVCNGGTPGTSFNLPDLRGRFLRASGPNLNAGQKFAFKTAADPTSPLQVSFTQMPNNMEDSVLATTISPNAYMVEWQQYTQTFSIAGFDNESRPVNMYLQYIIKAESETASQPSGSNPAANVPLGAVIPYAGKDGTQPGTFPDWILCDGRTTAIQQPKIPSIQPFATLLAGRFNTLNTPSGSVATPNLTGMFVRGVDLDGVVDPDHGQRIAAPDGTAQGTGTTQTYATQIRNAQITMNYWSDQSMYQRYYTGQGGDQHSHIQASGLSSSATFSGGGKETRPINVAVSYWINTQATVALQQIPIGGIIGITQSDRPNTPPFNSTWQYCDGSNDLSQTNYASLYNLLGNLWGSGQNSDSMALPDLRNQFLRAANPSGTAAPGVDPEWSERLPISLNPKGPIQVGTGSYQNYATARPTALKMGQSIAYNTNTQSNQTDSSSSSNVPQANPNPKYNITNKNGDDSETAPASLVADLYIRCQ